MTTELLTDLTALLARWDKMAWQATYKLETADKRLYTAYYAGVMFGLETARDELAAALASAMLKPLKHEK
jgi:hypothetical protein